MWTDENRARYDRNRLRYPSDVTDEEWALIAPAYSAGQARGQQADREFARDRQRTYVHSEHRLPMAGDPEGPAAALDAA